MKPEDLRKSPLFKKVRPHYRSFCKVLADCVNDALNASDNAQQAAAALQLAGIPLEEAAKRLAMRSADLRNRIANPEDVGNSPDFRRAFTLMAIELLAGELNHPPEGT